MKIDRDYIAEVKEKLIDGWLPIPEELTRATRGLFWENRHQTPAKPYYNLGERDHAGTLSMYAIFMQCPTEYDAALVLLGSLRHWNKLCEATWFKPYIDQWRHDMAVRDAALGKAVVYNAAKAGDVQSGKVLMNENKGSHPGKTASGKKANPKPKPNSAEFQDDIDAFLEAGTKAMKDEQLGRKH